MAGGKGNIKPEDGKQFEEGNKAAEKWSEDDALKLGSDLLEWLKKEDDNIFFEDFLFLSCDESKYKGKIYTTLPAYLAKKFTSFSSLLETCKNIEKIKLKKFGAFDKLNPSIVKFLLSAEYGMTVNITNDHKSSDGSMSPKPKIDYSNASEEEKKILKKFYGITDEF